MTPTATEWISDELAALDRRAARRRPRTIEGPIAPRVRIDGRERIVLCSNSYLGLAHDPRLVAAACHAAATWGTGSGASRLVSGTLALHRDVEAELARLKGTEDAVLFANGYQANLGAITALVGPDDLVVSDELNHASIIDACRQSRADVAVYRHADVEHARYILEQRRDDAQRCLLVTDGVFSMEGDLAPLDRLQRIAELHDAMVLVDDAHGTGVLGPDGAGTIRHLGVRGIDVEVATLSKALGAEGGFVAGDHDVCEWLRNKARSYVYSTAPAPPSLGAARESLRILRDEPDRRAHLATNALRLRRGLRVLGYDVRDDPTPIIPIVVGDDADAVYLSDALFECDVFVPAIRPPTVPVGTARLRASVMATHTANDIDDALVAFHAARPRPGVIARPAHAS